MTFDAITPPLLTLDDLNRMSADQAAPLLQSCCGAREWVSRMLDRRPFHQLDALLSTADHVWRSLSSADWLEAFSHHPRLGEQRAHAATTTMARDWSAAEQSRISDATQIARAALADANRAYEARFGYICIICATGKSVEDLLAITRSRLANTPAVELPVAAEEQRKITRLRLARLVEATPTQLSA